MHFLTGSSSRIAAQWRLRKFYEAASEHLYLRKSFTVFGIEGLIVGIGNNIRVSKLDCSSTRTIDEQVALQFHPRHQPGLQSL
ncbi:hypothetical protein BJX64DRAFT_251665 [Aspergillus heterothallicus]